MKVSLSCVGSDVIADLVPAQFGSDFTRNRNNYKFCYWYLQKSQFSPGKRIPQCSRHAHSLRPCHICVRIPAPRLLKFGLHVLEIPRYSSNLFRILTEILVSLLRITWSR